MAEDNLKDFTINWMITGFLITCLISFTIVFMFNNNPQGLGDEGNDIFNTTYSGMSSNILETPTDVDSILNITANTNPEASDLGSRDSVASAYDSRQISMSYWEASKNMIGWVFTGDIGNMLIMVFSGIIGFLSFYFIVKYIRNGI